MHYKLISDLDKTTRLDSQDRGLHYGDGLFETMLLSDGHIKYWPEHYARLSLSAKKLYIDCPDKSWFEQKLKPFIDLEQRLVIKIILNRGSGGRGLNFPDDLVSNIYLLKYKTDKTSLIQSVKAMFSDITLPVNHNLAGLKHLNRLDYVLATQQLKGKGKFNEALLLNHNGHVIEGIVNNLFFVKSEQIYTPDLKFSGVNGIMRELVIKKLKQRGKKVKISNYTKNDIETADECFLCNSVQGIRPIIQLEDIHFTIGKTSKDLQNIIHGHSGN